MLIVCQTSRNNDQLSEGKNRKENKQRPSYYCSCHFISCVLLKIL